MSSSQPLTSNEVSNLWRHMANHFNARVIQKDDSTFMSAISIVMPITGMRRDDFLRNYATTIGKNIYVPFTPGVSDVNWDLTAQARVCVHECEHIMQWRSNSLYNVQYLTFAVKRALYEAKAYSAGAELSNWMFKDCESAESILNRIKRGYAINDRAEREARSYLQNRIVRIKNGAVDSKPAQEAIEFLKRNSYFGRNR